MSKTYKLKAFSENETSAFTYDELIFGRSDFKLTFTIFDETQVMFHQWSSTMMLDEVSEEFTTNARVKYDLLFNGNPPLTSMGFKDYGQLQSHDNCEKYYKIFNGHCGGSLEIFDDNRARLMFFGSGVHYQKVYKGKLELISINN